MIPIRLLLLAPIGLLGCSPLERTGTPPGPPESRLLVMSEAPGPLASDPPTAVLTPPKLFPVWIPSHVDRERDLLIGEHWIFFKLGESEWFTDRLLESALPPVAGEASPQSLRTVRSVTGFEKALVPYQEAR